MAAAKRRFIATVKAHILNILEKTGFRNRTELAVRAKKLFGDSKTQNRTL